MDRAPRGALRMRFKLYGDYGYAHLKALEREGDAEGLIAALQTPKIKRSARRRAAVATSLSRIHSTPSATMLAEMLRTDSAESVRRMAARGLGDIGDPEALPALRAALDDPSDQVQMWAIRSLGRLGDRESVETLIGLLKDSDWGLRSYSAAALGEVGDQRAIDPLVPLLGDESRTVRLAAGRALEALGYERP